MTDDNVWRREEVEIAPALEVFEIRVVAEERDEVVLTREEIERRQLEQVRQAALTFLLESAGGEPVSPPDLSTWPRRHADVFREELARLRAERAAR